VSAGPFRFNFSKGGVGASVGVRGLRIGTGPRGHYVHVGYGGIYYRGTLGPAGRKLSPSKVQGPAALSGKRRGVSRGPTPMQSAGGVQMIEIESADVATMRAEGFSDLLDDLNRKQAQGRSFWVLFWIIVAATLGAYVAAGPLGLLGLLALLPAIPLGGWLDSFRRTSVLFYDLDDRTRDVYEHVTQAFDEMMQTNGKWHMSAGGDIHDLATRKRNAGATRLVEKKPTTLAYTLPAVIKSNITPPTLHVGRQVIYFFPDVALIEDGKRFGAVGYPKLDLRWEDSQFIEDGKVPGDAYVVGHTWKHPNKSGGPDRRFRDNRQIPVCLYETLYITSDSGVNEAVQFSRTDVSQGFAHGLGQLPGQQLSFPR
jgi:hypothetical protein